MSLPVSNLLIFGAFARPGRVSYRIACAAVGTWSVRVVRRDGSVARLPMDLEEPGTFAADDASGGPGDLYWFEPREGQSLADPAARFLPAQAANASEVLEPWQANSTPPLQRRSAPPDPILYRLNAGRDLRAGGWSEAITHLARIENLGANAIVLESFLTVRKRGQNQRALCFPYAPSAELGRPEAMKQFLEAAHVRNFRVILAFSNDEIEGAREALRTLAGTDGRSLEEDGRLAGFLQGVLVYWMDEFKPDGVWLESKPGGLPSERIAELAQIVRDRGGLFLTGGTAEPVEASAYRVNAYNEAIGSALRADRGKGAAEATRDLGEILRSGFAPPALTDPVDLSAGGLRAKARPGSAVHALSLRAAPRGFANEVRPDALRAALALLGWSPHIPEIIWPEESAGPARMARPAGLTSEHIPNAESVDSPFTEGLREGISLEESAVEGAGGRMSGVRALDEREREWTRLLCQEVFRHRGRFSPGWTELRAWSVRAISGVVVFRFRAADRRERMVMSALRPNAQNLRADPFLCPPRQMSWRLVLHSADRLFGGEGWSHGPAQEPWRLAFPQPATVLFEAVSD